MNCSFTIYQTTGGEYYFKLKTAAGQLLLTGNHYATASACKNDILSIRLNAGRAGAYERRMTQSSCFQFVIKNLEGARIAKSEAFATSYTRDKTMEMVKRITRQAPVHDLT